MTKKSTTHVFKFLPPVMPSVEKTVNLHRFKKVYKQKITAKNVQDME